MVDGFNFIQLIHKLKKYFSLQMRGRLKMVMHLAGRNLSLRGDAAHRQSIKACLQSQFFSCIQHHFPAFFAV